VSKQASPTPIAEEVLDRMIGTLEGPINSAFERVLSSNLVLVPLSLSMVVGLKIYRTVMGKSSIR
jgi:hypothetical protein